MKPDATIITLNDMEFYAYHGCYEEERVIGNRFSVTLRMAYDASQAAASDDLSDALNYAEAYRIVRKEMEQTSHLLEQVASRILNRLMDGFSQLQWAEVTVCKQNPPMQGPVRDVGVTMSLQREKA